MSLSEAELPLLFESPWMQQWQTITDFQDDYLLAILVFWQWQIHMRMRGCICLPATTIFLLSPVTLRPLPSSPWQNWTELNWLLLSSVMPMWHGEINRGAIKSLQQLLLNILTGIKFTGAGAASGRWVEDNLSVGGGGLLWFDTFGGCRISQSTSQLRAQSSDVFIRYKWWHGHVRVVLCACTLIWGWYNDVWL